MAARSTALLASVALLVTSAAGASSLTGQTSNAARAAGSPLAGCEDGAELAHEFDSGAGWSLCARIDAAHGLELRELRYRAPGDAARPVLAALHLGSILLDDRSGAAPQPLFANAALRELSAQRACAGERVSIGTLPDALCMTQRPTGLLAKYGDLEGVHGAEWRLEARRRGPLHEWLVQITLAEDGRITPALSIGAGHGTGATPAIASDQNAGTAAGMTVGVATGGVSRGVGPGTLAGTDTRVRAGSSAANVLATWRVAFALDGPAADRIEELDFILDPALGSRRPMRATPIEVETLRVAAPASFRGWRAVDANASGYWIDGQSGATGWERGANWTRFEVAVSAASQCETHATPLPDARLRPGCEPASAAQSLDSIVDGESLAGRDPVLWISTALALPASAVANAESGDRTTSFDLLPFDWTAKSPFALSERGGARGGGRVGPGRMDGSGTGQ